MRFYTSSPEGVLKTDEQMLDRLKELHEIQLEKTGILANPVPSEMGYRFKFLPR